MKDEESEVGRGAVAILLVIGLLIGLSVVPAITVGDVELRRVNILSQITEQQGLEPIAEQELEIDLSEYEVDIKQVEDRVREARELIAMNDQVHNTTAPSETQKAQEIPKIQEASKAQETQETPTQATIERRERATTAIEEYDSLSSSAIGRFYRKLSDSTQTTRIAVLGDSFIEGDILTQDLRETMQSRYGGRGAGFAPFDSPTSKYRGTVRTESSGWRTHNIMQRRDAPAALMSHWFVSGWLSEGSIGARSKLRLTSIRDHCNHCSRVRLLFKSRGESELTVAVNGGEAERYIREGGDQLQQIVIEQDSINEVELRVERGEGFVGYGAGFEGGRVAVDNFAIRSNNGQAVLWSDPVTNVQFDALVGGYDLVVLQYGLNLLQSGVRNYSRYGEQIEKLIAFVEECFPRAAVVVWSVSDRSIKRDGNFVPMDEARDMRDYQRAAADSMQVSFWDTYATMEAMGGMPRFVANRWAAKDYTHINSAGGRELGRAFAEAIEESRLRWCPPPIETPRLERITPEKVEIKGLYETKSPWER